MRRAGASSSRSYNRLVLLCLSASHRNCPLPLLEALSAAADSVSAGLPGAHPGVAGAVVLSTCNRFETYLDVDQPEGTSPLDPLLAVVDTIHEASGVDAEALRSSFELTHGNAVASHLFAVSAGLESVVVGETEIAGQVRRALDAAREARTTTPELERLFQGASRTSRAVKSRTGLDGAGRSLVRLALELAESRVRDWAAARVLLVGTGRYAAVALAALRERGALDVAVHSPSGRAASFAAAHGVGVVEASGYAAAAARADVIVACTASATPVVDAALLRAGEADAPEPAGGGSSPAAERLIVDLGLPRNVAPDVADVEGVRLLDLETVRLHAPIEELGAVDEARGMIVAATREFGAAGEEHRLAPTVVALREHVFDILEAEIARSRARADHTARTEEALRHLVGVLLHTPMARSREHAARGEHAAWIAGVEAVFGVTAPAEAPRPAAVRNSGEPHRRSTPARGISRASG